MEYAEARPEATPIQADDLLHLGDRAAVARALSCLARSDRLLRVCRGVYMRPIPTRFGLRAPSLEQAITALASLWGETIVSNGGDAANWLGLTTQNAVRTVYLTSGPDRLLHFGAHQVKLLHAPRWQLAAAHGTAGTVIRAISSHGSVPTRSRGVWMPCCRSSRGKTWTTRRRTGRPAQVDGGAAEQAYRACLRSNTSASRKPRGARPCRRRHYSAAGAPSFSRRTSGSSQLSPFCSKLRSADIWCSRAARPSPRCGERSAGSRRTSISRTIFVASSRIRWPMPATRRCRPHAARRGAGRGRSAPASLNGFETPRILSSRGRSTRPALPHAFEPRPSNST